ncbi:MAG: PH domain-containing protein [Bryobacteraceae bacterium]|nr:PH domain-containing protein [Bryobacteraceae bacterium]
MTTPPDPSRLAAVPASIAAIERPAEQLMTWYFIRAVFSTVAFPVLLPVLYFRYHTMRYRFDEEGIRMSWGILFRHEVILNYSRIQDIHVESNFLERMLGLARIEIQTAAGTSGAHMTLEGLADHMAMRDFLYSRMRGARGVAPQPRLLETDGAASGELVQVLQSVADELRAIRLNLAATAPQPQQEPRANG